MKHVFTVAGTALWATTFTIVGFAFTTDDAHDMLEIANIVALMACVPTFYLIAETMFERHIAEVKRDHDDLLGEISRVVGRADAEREVRHVGRR